MKISHLSITILILISLATFTSASHKKKKASKEDIHDKEDDIATSPHNLWPLPSTYTVLGNTVVQINNYCNFKFTFISGGQIPQVQELTKVYKKFMFPNCDDEDYENIIKISKDNHHNKKNAHKKESKSKKDANRIVIEDDSEAEKDIPKAAFNSLVVTIKDTSNVLVSRNTDESYILEVNQIGFAIIANNYVGFVRGLETFSQLITRASDGSPQITNTPVHIQDQPRFKHRGVMLDTARHYISVNKIKEVMDGMMFAKLNVFHWHMTDSDSFPIYLPTHPELQKNGAFSPDQTYNETDIKDIVQYAITRGIKIIPEIDSPAHLASWANTEEFKPLINCSETMWYHGIPLGQIDPTLEATYDLVQDIINDLKGYFVWEDIHLGCDEVFEYCWNNNRIKEWMKDHNIGTWQELFDYYRGKIGKLVGKDRNAVFWGNTVTQYLNFDSDQIIQYWGDNAHLRSFFKRYPDNEIVVSSFDTFYFDCGLGNYFGNTAFCNPMNTWRDILEWNITRIIDSNDLSRVLGVEAAQWGELNSDVTIMDRMFPRLTALGEGLWSPMNHPYQIFYASYLRMEAWRGRVNQRGYQIGPITAGYCEKNPYNCFKDEEEV